MPRPRYIICSENRLVDNVTGLTTHVNVIDKFQFAPFKLPPAPEGKEYIVPVLKTGQIFLTSVWMLEDGDDPNDEYRFEVLIQPPGKEPNIIGEGEFRFQRRFFRVDSPIAFTTESRIESSGILLLINRIRRKRDTDSDWLTQSFPLEVEVKQLEAQLKDRNSKSD